MTVPEMIKQINDIRESIQYCADYCTIRSQRALANDNSDLAKVLSVRSTIYNAADDRLLYAVEFLEIIEKGASLK